MTIVIGTSVADSNRHGVKIERGELYFWSIDATGASAPRLHSFIEHQIHNEPYDQILSRLVGCKLS
tara:strand:- start:13 stop:210 length:198 start_codon:yes stop_codon:yes gene_type:complete